MLLYATSHMQFRDQSAWALPGNSWKYPEERKTSRRQLCPGWVITNCKLGSCILAW